MITDELREWKGNINTRLQSETVLALRSELEGIADRIDAEYQKALDEWKAEHGQMWLKGYAEFHAELLEGNETIASDLEGCGLIRLPKDADGEYIHVGDMLTDGECTFMAYELSVYGDGSWSIRNEDGIAWAACEVTHYHAPTVEDVLREFAEKIIDSQIPSMHPTYEEAIAEFAARLRLAEEVDK